MKTSIYLIFALLILSSFSNEKTNSTEATPLFSDSSIFIEIETQPEFPGGVDSISSFIVKNVKYPKEALKKEIQGRVLISFVVNAEGYVEDVKPLLPPEKWLGYGLEEEAVRIVSAMPRWTPGIQDGKKVKVRYTLPIYFTLD